MKLYPFILSHYKYFLQNRKVQIFIHQHYFNLLTSENNSGSNNSLIHPPHRTAPSLCSLSIHTYFNYIIIGNDRIVG